MARAYVVIISVLTFAIACGDNGGGDDGTSDDAALADADDGDGTSSDIDAPDPTGDGGTTDTPGNSTDAAVGTMCGTATCTTAQECCVQGQGRTCVTAGTCTGVNFDCDGSEDCDLGEVCCYGGGGGNGGTSCVASASCAAPTCSTMTDCPNANQECCTLGQFSVCAMQCPGP